MRQSGCVGCAAKSRSGTRESGYDRETRQKRGETGGMSTTTVFKTCRPRGDVLSRAVVGGDFAANLAPVVAGPGELVQPGPGGTTMQGDEPKHRLKPVELARKPVKIAGVAVKALTGDGWNRAGYENWNT